MALDEPKETDTKFDIDGFQYIVNKEFLDMVQPIKVDFREIGFSLSCNKDFSAAACSSCGTSSTSCCGE